MEEFGARLSQIYIDNIKNRYNPTRIVTVYLRFELFRECVDGRAEPLGVWVLKRASQNTEKTRESFDFTFCESLTCKTGCCTYFVRVTPIEIGRSEDIQIEVTVSNGRIAALAQER